MSKLKSLSKHLQTRAQHFDDILLTLDHYINVLSYTCKHTDMSSSQLEELTMFYTRDTSSQNCKQ